MSAWRKEASKRLPEFQKIIASREVDNPMMLWIELHTRFAQLCRQDPPPVELLRRLWGYAKWCMDQGHEDVQTAAALAFCEHLLDTDASGRLLPQVMSRQDYEGLRSLLLYHDSQEAYERGLHSFAAPKMK